MWDAELQSQALEAGLLLVAVIVPALVPSRREPQSLFLSSQRWGYRDVIIVFVLLTIGRLIPSPSALDASGMRLWAIEYGLTGTFMIAIAWALVRLKHRHPWRALGFNSRSALCDALWALRIALGFISALTAVVLVLRLTMPDMQPTASDLQRGAWRAHFLDFIAAFGVAAVLMPVAEEITFRGLAYGPLLRKFGAIGAALGTALFWAGAHYSGPSLASGFKMASAFVLGILYAEVYRRRESIVPTVAFHIVGNTTNVFIGDPHLQTLLPLGISAVVLWIGSIAAFRWVSPAPV